MAKRYLFLIRNAQYNPTGNMGGPLTDIGLKQATLTTQALRDIPVDHIYSSPYRQAVETAKIIAILNRRITIQETPMLRQYDVVDMMQDTLTRTMLSENSGDRQKRQLEAAYQTFFMPPESYDQYFFLICHANIIRDLICRALGVQPETWAHMVINNCGITVVSVAPDASIALEAYNDTNHLPDALQTET